MRESYVKTPFIDIIIVLRKTAKHISRLLDGQSEYSQLKNT
jgi:hypothetical protein